MISMVKLRKIHSSKTGSVVVGSSAMLPLHFRRSFQLWSYEVSHRRLTLLSQAAGGSESVEVEFLDVLGMKVKSSYAELVVKDAEDLAKIDDFVVIPERHKGRYQNLIVSDGALDGFVVCGSVRIHER